MAFFTFCINCGKKIMINEPGTKLKHFNGKIIICKCSSVFVVFGKTLKYFSDLTLKEILKYNLTTIHCDIEREIIFFNFLKGIEFKRLYKKEK